MLGGGVPGARCDLSNVEILRTQQFTGGGDRSLAVDQQLERYPTVAGCWAKFFLASGVEAERVDALPYPHLTGLGGGIEQPHEVGGGVGRPGAGRANNGRDGIEGQ